MSKRVYLLTFMGYVSLHALRTIYSYSKPYFQKEYELPKMYLAILDSSIYIFLGIGFLIRSPIVSQHQLKQNFIVTSILSCLCYALFPFLAAIHFLDSSNIQILLLLLMMGYGYFQLNFWPTILYIFKDYFRNEEDGCLIGFWSSAGDFGNIFGFLFSSLLLLQFGLPWQTPLLIFSTILLLMSVAIYFFANRKSQQQRQNQFYAGARSSNRIPSVNAISWSQYWQFIKKSVFQIKTALFLLSFCLFKAMLYTFLLWLPTYLDNKGRKDLSAQIPMLFNLATIFGSFLMGKLYQKNKDQEHNQMAPQLVLATAGLVVIAGLIIINLTNFEPVQFRIVVMVEGFAIGGVFNILCCNQTIRIAGEDPQYLDLVTSFSMGVGNFSVGLVELMVGLSLGQQQERDGSSSGYDNVFKVQLVVAIIAAVLLIIRANLIFRDEVQPRQKEIELKNLLKQ